ncbi:MAG: DegT/DnrJ/EryC1/StrS family aminotransferase [Paludibacter sp.]
MIGLMPRLNIKYGFIDAFIALKSIFTKLAPSETNIFYFNHARTGLRLALSSLNLAKGSKIAVMVYNCYTVMNAVKTAGFEIEFIDIKDDFSIDIEDLKKKRTNFSAIIVTHLFGIPNDIDIIKATCPGLPIIEDCAHAFLSSIHGNKSGSTGDLAVFSMGLGKFPSIGPGGYLVVNNSIYQDKIKELTANLDKPSMKTEFATILKSLTLGILHNPLIYKYISKPVLKERNNEVDDEIKYDNHESHILKSSLGLFFARKRNFQFQLDRQKQHRESIITALNESKTQIRPCESAVYEPNGFMIPFLVENRSDYINRFQKNHIEIGSHFSKSIQWAFNFGYTDGYCANAEKISTKMLVCPCHYNLKQKHIKLINQLILTTI